MRTEREKMLASELYDAYDADLLKDMDTRLTICE
jgi:hypothetical protein